MYPLPFPVWITFLSFPWALNSETERNLRYLVLLILHQNWSIFKSLKVIKTSWFLHPKLHDPQILITSWCYYYVMVTPQVSQPSSFRLQQITITITITHFGYTHPISTVVECESFLERPSRLFSNNMTDMLLSRASSSLETFTYM